MTKKGLTPAEFNKFLNQKMDEDQIELFYRANAINPLKSDLFRDFTISLIDMIHDTYPGDDINFDDYYMNHFNHCFDKVIENFKQEKLYFNGNKREIHDYLYITFEEAYYHEPKKNQAINILKNVYDVIFDMENMNKTKSDLEIFLDIYQSFIKFFKKDYATVTNFN